MKRFSLVLSCILLLLPATARAQVQAGFPPYSTLSGTPDIVNIANLNAHLTMPVLTKQGRGLNFVYNLTFDSSVLYPFSTGEGEVLWEVGSAINATSFGYVGMATVLTTPCIYQGGGIEHLQQTGTVYEYRWSYVDAANTSHGFGTTDQVSGTITDTNCSGDSTTSIDVTANDGSGYTLSATGGTLNSLTNSAGQRMNVPINGPSPDGVIVTDRNGNEITSNSSGVFTDTLGTTVLTVAGSGTPSSPITMTYTAPSGASAVYTEKFTAYNVETNFGCSGIEEYGPLSVNLVSEIDLPDIAIAPNDKYTFTYEATPDYSGYVTGRVTKITLPTGGAITYSYSGGNNGITCADGTAATLTRTTPDGTWTYAHTESGTSWSTTVTDPQGNKSVYTFGGNFGTEVQVYSGSSTLLKTVYVCYNSTLSNCNSGGVAQPFTSVATYTQWPSGLESETNVDYNGYGLPTEEDDYDYGSNAPGNLLRKTLITYASLGNDINNMPASVTVENGSGGTIAETTYQYDQSSLASPPGTTPQHVSVSGSRGNATTVSYLVSSSTYLLKTFTYYNTGNVDGVTDVNGGDTTYNYLNATSTCGNAFPTSVTEPLSLSRSMTWNCTGGVEASVTDENGQTVSTAYSDAYFWRPATSTDQEGNVMDFYYQPNSSYPTYEVASYMDFNSGNSVTSDIQYLDGLGRTYVDQHWQSPNSSTLDSTSYTFDANGRPYSTSGPCSIGYASTCSGPTTTQTYDALNRPLVTTDGGGGTATLSYSANDTLQTIGPAPTGENTKRRRSEYNGIGQLTSVCEITAGTTNAPAGTCSQTTSATGYWTKYTNDVLGDLLTVSQNAQSSTPQSRTYTYDGLGRMTSETNPETGTKTYVFDTDSTCGTSDGDLVKRVDAAGNVTCYTYDVLHRVTSITYPSGPNSSNTPNKCFVYDAAIDSQSVNYTKARLVEAYTTTSACSETILPATITDEAFGYTVRGETQDVYESTPNSGGYFHVDETYWANGAPETISDLTGLTTISYGADGEGRTSTVSAGTGQNPVTATSYNVASQPTQVTLGSGDNDAYQYDSNTFRMTQYQFNVNGQADTGKLGWNANWSLGSLDVTDAFNSSDTQNCSYTHDDLARIAGANCGSVFSDTYSYDAFGNLSKSGTFQFQPGYNSNNQMSSGATYDSNGDVLSDSLHSYAWNSETRPSAINTLSLTYDALGRMVEQGNSGSYTQIVWPPTGRILAYMRGQSLLKAYVPLPAGDVAIYLPGNIYGYRHMDWLGSARLISTAGRSEVYDTAYTPFGEPYATSGSSVPGFTDMTQDTASNLYDFPYREYEIYGRWPSPDPAGMAAANPANPQTWNRYAYVMNNPLASTDSLGLYGPGGPRPIAILVNQDFFNAFEALEWLNLPVPIPVDLGEYYVSVQGGVLPFYPDGYTGPAELSTFVYSANAAFWWWPSTPNPQTPSSSASSNANSMQQAEQQAYQLQMGNWTQLEAFAQDVDNAFAQSGAQYYFCANSPKQNVINWTLEGTSKGTLVGAFTLNPFDPLIGAGGGWLLGNAASWGCSELGIYGSN